jgi:DNA-directed RNA polymerase subunit RPC12/RpoP
MIYQCENCGREFTDIEADYGEDGMIRCPNCLSENLTKVLEEE